MKTRFQFSTLPASFRLVRSSAIVLVLLGVSGLSAAETAVVGRPPNPGDEATLRGLETESGRAVTTRDYATLERLWSEGFVVNAPNNRVYASRAAVFDIFRHSAADLYSSYDKHIECIAFDADLAIVMGVETVTPAGANQPAQRRYTNVWRSTGGTWRLIARQATMLPPDATPLAKKS